jgi:hypothetical protein
MDLAVGCQSLKVPATRTVVAVGCVNSKRTGTSCGPALRALSWLWLCFMVGYASRGRLIFNFGKMLFPFHTTIMHRETLPALWGVHPTSDLMNPAQGSRPG